MDSAIVFQNAEQIVAFFFPTALKKIEYLTLARNCGRQDYSY